MTGSFDGDGDRMVPAVRGAPPRRGAARLLTLAVLALTVGLAGVWSYVAERQLTLSATADASAHLEHGRALFGALRARTQDALRAQCRVLVEDPRVKSTLATDGMDEATVADILADLGRLRRAGFLMVLSPEGRVFAEAGAAELRGLDLSGSTIVKHARGSNEAVVGSWVIGGKIIDLAITSVQVDRTIVAYLVVGQPVDAELLKVAATGAGVEIAIVVGSELPLATANADSAGAVFARVAREPGTFAARVVDVGSDSYVASLAELEDAAISHPRLAVVSAAEPTHRAFDILRWLLWLPPVLVAIAFALSLTRSGRSS